MRTGNQSCSFVRIVASYLFLPDRNRVLESEQELPDTPPSNDTEAFMPNALQVMMEEMLPAKDVSRFSAVLAQDEFRTELDRLFSDWKWGIPEELKFKPFKAHDDRCTFEISGRTGTEWHSVIGKVHTIDRTDVFNALQAVEQSGFGPASEFGIARPLAYLPHLHVLFEEKIHGKWAMDTFMNGDPGEQIETARRSGLWLARFHSLAPRTGETDGPDDLLPAIRYYAAQVRKYGDQFATKSDLLLNRVEAAKPPAESLDFCAGHGSYIPEHVFLSGPRTIVIDIDEHDRADPGRDLAWFTVSLQRLGLKKLGSLRARDEPVDAFLKAYESSRGADSLKHYRFFKAAECLHRAHRDLYKRKTPIPQWANIMLDEGLSTLP